jgi:serine/threonine-protein kinase
MTPVFLKALARGGKIGPAELQARRGAWIDGWKRRLTPEIARYLWIYGYAAIADTPAEAEEALAALPPYEPLPGFRPGLLADAAVGHTLWLGGRRDEAIAALRRAAGDCDVFENPVEWVHASLWLGQALEAKGDPPGACAAYGDVVRRWSGLGKRSTSVAAASKRRTALGCRTPASPVNARAPTSGTAVDAKNTNGIVGGDPR